jgi:hypothetical protein
LYSLSCCGVFGGLTGCTVHTSCIIVTAKTRFYLILHSPLSSQAVTSVITLHYLKT